MEKKIGPTGKFPFGGPTEPSDVGAIDASLTVDQEHQRVYIQFGMMLDWFVLSKPKLRAFIDSLEEAYKELK